VDALSRHALEKLGREAAGDPVAREHVTGYFKQHPDFVRIVHAAPDPRLAHKATRLTVDTPDDLAFIEALHERMQAKAGERRFPICCCCSNASRSSRHQRLRAPEGLGAEGGLALIRCDGGGMLGFGHVGSPRWRAVCATARLGVLFALNGEVKPRRSSVAGFETIVLPRNSQTTAFTSLVGVKKPDMLTRMHAPIFPATCLRIGTRVGGCPDRRHLDRRPAATHALPCALAASRPPLNGTNTIVRVGWEWALLGFDPHDGSAGAAQRRMSHNVSMGGSDPSIDTVSPPAP
jgi:spore coat polysaccharide biosynthesis protein SpsF